MVSNVSFKLSLVLLLRQFGLNTPYHRFALMKHKGDGVITCFLSSPGAAA